MKPSQVPWGKPRSRKLFGTHDGRFGSDLPACLLVVAVAGIPVLGMKLSSRVTAVIAGIKVTADRRLPTAGRPAVLSLPALGEAGQ
ncbi:hypothetical protein [Streptomyces pinistramenti]|uniref:hypothetical protein n=1 Tax=Streptomyces pinistramenti TaxID=2884812 RepID=UPI001D0660BF|nr:hypothetical protein [Streptomyces pinistramenti]MCB5910918.1 hypothetical protein [Streptomyces pinistramenti]